MAIGYRMVSFHISSTIDRSPSIVSPLMVSFFHFRFNFNLSLSCKCALVAAAAVSNEGMKIGWVR